MSAVFLTRRPPGRPCAGNSTAAPTRAMTANDTRQKSGLPVSMSAMTLISPGSAKNSATA